MYFNTVKLDYIAFSRTTISSHSAHLAHFMHSGGQVWAGWLALSGVQLQAHHVKATPNLQGFGGVF